MEKQHSLSGKDNDQVRRNLTMAAISIILWVFTLLALGISKDVYLTELCKVLSVILCLTVLRLFSKSPIQLKKYLYENDPVDQGKIYP